MDIPGIKKRLKEAGLKLTNPRKKILEFFLGREEAVTYPDLLQLTDTYLDRVTIYRTLKSFEEIGLLHRVFAGDGTQYFSLVGLKENTPKAEKQQHLSFCCIACKAVYTLEDYVLPDIELPQQYDVISLDMTVTGICKKCTNK